MTILINQMEWKQIEGYEWYEISTTGQVRTRAKNKDKLMKVRMYGEYQAYKLSKDNKGRLVTIHRLIALHFIPNPNGYDYVDHINRDKLDNRIENLRWVTFSENRFNTPAQKNNKLGEKYISRRGTSFRVSLRWVNIFRDFKTLTEAIEWRNEYLTSNNLLGRL